VPPWLIVLSLAQETFSGRKCQLASIILGNNIVVEEVHIQSSLDGTRNIHKPIMTVKRFVVRAIDPIEDVKEAIGTKKKT